MRLVKLLMVIFFCIKLIAQQPDTVYSKIGAHYNFLNSGYYYEFDSTINHSSEGYVDELLNKQGQWTYKRNGIIYKIVSLTNSKLDGLSVSFDNEGKLMETIYYSNGLENGLSFCYYRDGTTKSKTMYVDGITLYQYEFSKNGLTILECLYPAYDSNNFNCSKSGDLFISLTTFINDSIEFKGNQWYDNGEIKLKCTRENKGINAIISFEYFYINGIKASEGMFENRCIDQYFCKWYKVGIWRWYDKDGLLYEMKNF